LPECQFFRALDHMPFFADFTHDRFVFGGHRPSSPRRRALTWVTLRNSFRGDV
jgi:hypothetical protein